MKTDMSQSQGRSPYHFSIVKAVSTEIKIKGSRFIGNCYPVDSSDDCDRLLAEQSKTYYGATHLCYGYQIGIGDRAIFRSNDANEPSGTAGAPILNVIRGENLTNILVVVVRYFGGTKLGIGGLVKAYTEITKATLAKSKRIRMEIMTTLKFKIDFNYLDQTMRELSKLNGKIIKKVYDKKVDFTISIPESNSDHLKNSLINLSRGGIKILSEN